MKIIINENGVKKEFVCDSFEVVDDFDKSYEVSPDYDYGLSVRSSIHGNVVFADEGNESVLLHQQSKS